jgi:hypothetical protein
MREWFSGVGLSDLDNLIESRAFTPETQVLASVWFRSPLFFSPARINERRNTLERSHTGRAVLVLVLSPQCSPIPQHVTDNLLSLKPETNQVTGGDSPSSAAFLEV